MKPFKHLYVIAGHDVFLEPDRFPRAAAAVLPLYQVLWTTAFFNDAESLPTILAPDDPPEGDDWLAIAPLSLETFVAEFPEWKLGTTLFIDAADRPSIARRLEQPEHFSELDRVLFALAFARMGLHALFLHLKHEDSVDDWSVFESIRQAIQASDQEQRRSHFSNAFETLHSARSVAFPASIHLLDLALHRQSPPADAKRFEMKSPINLFFTGDELEKLALSSAGSEANPGSEVDSGLLQAIQQGVERQTIEIVGGAADDRPWSPMTLESRCWQLRVADRIHQKIFGKRLDSFGSRTNALTPTLPQLLLKFQFKSVLHLSFDGSKLPQMKKPKFNWNGPDNVSLEALSRGAAAVEDRAEFLTTIARLAKSLDEDRGPVLPLAHWWDSGAEWFEDWLHSHEYAPVLGRFETVSDYFLNSSYSDLTTATYGDEYSNRALERPADAVSVWIDRTQRRVRFDAVLSLAALTQLATLGEFRPDINVAGCENTLEREQNTSVLDATLADLTQRSVTALAEELGRTSDAGKRPGGWYFFNACSFPRRVCTFLPKGSKVAVASPVRGVQETPDGLAVVVDVPGWGWAFALSEGTESHSSGSSIVSGRKLRNEFIEVEIDATTGGIRGLWDVRTRHSRLGQQLYAAGAGKMVCRGRRTTRNGSVVGEIETTGDLLSRDGKTRWATYRQTARLWRGKPMLEIEIELDVKKTPSGPPEEDYYACRWAWPDDKAIVSVADGLTLFTHRGGTVESPLLIDIRERKLLTTLLCQGAAFAYRTEPKMADSVLIVRGESRRKFQLGVAVDFARPAAAALDLLTPVFHCEAPSGPKAGVLSGSFVKLGLSNVMASSLRPIDDHRVFLRLVETVGSAGRIELRFSKTPAAVRLINGLDETIFDLYPVEDQWALDFSANEIQMLEVLMRRANTEAVSPTESTEPTAENSDGVEEATTWD